jgi:hypothetical protein
MKKRYVQRRGFAATIAIVLIGLVGAVLLAMSGVFAIEARRARSETAEAQLRQMVLAGTGEAARLASSNSLEAGKAVSVALPETLVQQEGRLTLTPASPREGSLTLSMEAKLGRQTMRQSLAFTGANGQWRLASATLGDAPEETPAGQAGKVKP